jgi:DNA-binding MarR family transcriptional regulator
MSNSSLAKFGNVLGNVSSRGSAPATRESAPPTPMDVILKLLRDGMIPVSDLPDRTQLTSDVILDGVERLRAREMVEIVEVEEAGGRKFIRLTPRGYTATSTA